MRSASFLLRDAVEPLLDRRCPKFVNRQSPDGGSQRVVADGRALGVVGNGPHREIVCVENVEFALHLGLIVPTPRIQMGARDSNFQPVITPSGCQSGHFFKRNVGLLAGKQGVVPGRD